MVYYNLKALIKAIRATKTLADERALIVKESAAIRTSFKEDDSFTRHHNVAKLLYIYMLGYPAHFGQVECVKLVASSKFADKRLGYLGIMLLLDENQEVLTLVTNSLKNDLNNPSPSVVSLALCTFATVASEEMARDLVNEIEYCMGASSPLLRKKAALAALRCIHKVPELVDHFKDRAVAYLNDRNHGVLLTGATLITEICRIIGPEPFEYLVPQITKHIKQLLSVHGGQSLEHDVAGVADPFLQVKLLRLLRVLGSGGSTEGHLADATNDVLAQVATSIEGSKNVGNAILYESVLTILDVDAADDSLNTMAINILGKFLTHQDHNARYVALNTLSKVVQMDIEAVQRHRNTILQCLTDPDISIRRRSLELVYQLFNGQNARLLTKELLAFLQVADLEFKASITSNVYAAAERYATSHQWLIDTALDMFAIAGNHIRHEVLFSFIRLVQNAPTLQAYTALRLYSQLSQDTSQYSQTLAGVWVIGEFGDALLDPANASDVYPTPSDADVAALLDSVIQSPDTDSTIRQYAVMAAAKLVNRASLPTAKHSLLALIESFSRDPVTELQERAVDLETLLKNEAPSVSSAVLERMPAPPLKPTLVPSRSRQTSARAFTPRRSHKKLPSSGALLDVDTVQGSPKLKPQAAAQDLLLDLFGGSADAPQTSAPAPPAQPKAAASGLADLLADTHIEPEPPAPAAPPAFDTYTAYTNHGLTISLHPQVDSSRPNIMNVTATFSSTQPVSGLNFQAAVPKQQKLQMLAATSSDVAPGADATQLLRIVVPPKNAIRIRMRILFTLGDDPIQDQADFAFPPHVTL